LFAKLLESPVVAPVAAKPKAQSRENAKVPESISVKEKDIKFATEKVNKVLPVLKQMIATVQGVHNHAKDPV